MGKRPSKKYSIERVDNNGDYKPSNCKWGTYTEQARNQRIRKDNVSGKRGVSWYKSYSKWVVHIGLNYKLIHIGYFDNLKDAILAREKAEDDYWGI
uniref:AP2/ERF domain-containing protein n=1 Tax=viral metagenome TaxID=1070528 RepID=A0A6M3JTJ3_9ZZZZ